MRLILWKQTNILQVPGKSWKISPSTKHILLKVNSTGYNLRTSTHDTFQTSTDIVTLLKNTGRLQNSICQQIIHSWRENIPLDTNTVSTHITAVRWTAWFLQIFILCTRLLPCVENHHSAEFSLSKGNSSLELKTRFIYMAATKESDWFLHFLEPHTLKVNYKRLKYNCVVSFITFSLFVERPLGSSTHFNQLCLSSAVPKQERDSHSHAHRL